MCIRDRIRRVRAVAVVVEAALGVEELALEAELKGALTRRARRVIRIQDAAHAEGCLLYTSDAADERSSVDLGGRRIIKKKKKTEQDVTRDTSKKKLTSEGHVNDMQRE